MSPEESASAPPSGPIGASSSASPTINASTQNGPVVCVFCGSSSGSSPVHLAAARALAQVFHDNNISLVYGGGTYGLMGELARTLVSLSGPSSVHGIIPKALANRERDFTPDETAAAATNEQTYGRTTIVKDMHTRKHMMAKEVMSGAPGGGFVALSGGYGTLEELMEITTWNQLGIHDKPVVLYNVDGYYDGLIQWIKGAVTSGFVSPGNAGIVVEALSAEEVMVQIKEYRNAGDRLNLQWEHN